MKPEKTTPPVPLTHQPATLVQATPADLDTLLDWRMEVLRCVFSLPPETDTAALRRANEAYYRKHLPAGGHIACLARVEGQTVGCGGLCLHEEMPSPDNPSGRCGYLMNIYVRPSWRGRHIGTRLVRWLIGQALARGVTKVYLETSQAGRPLYRALGFGEMKDMMCLFSEK